ncbi:MAG: GNAT family N-acetyltransferase [Parachlamydiaceae bacterium]|nr:GNAT family N-acetyltransferase [Parachlamydiaceae bacterium]
MKTGYIQHFEHFFAGMSPALQNDKEAFVWVSGIPHPCYNIVSHLACDRVEETVEHLIQKMPTEVPHSFWVHPENRAEGLETILQKRGYTFLANCPVLAWSVGAVQAHESPDIKVQLADDKKTFYEILTIASHFGAMLGECVAELLENVDAEHYIVYFSGKPVGIGSLFFDDTVGVVSNVATLQEYQKRGCGRALMVALMRRAQEKKLEKLVLGTSAVAEKLYDSLGFIKVFDITMYQNKM